MIPSDTEKCLYIVSPTESKLTSRGRRHPNLAQYLSSNGWKVKYISSDFNHAEKRTFSDEECGEVQNELPYSLTLIRNGKYQRNLSLKRVLWNQRIACRSFFMLDKVLREGDILIVPSRPPELIYAAAVLKRRHGCRIVLDIRDIWPDALSESSHLLRRGFGAYCDFFLRRSVARFDAYIHVAPSFVPWLHRYAPGSRSTFIPLGFDEKRWGLEAPQPRRDRGNQPVRLVYCGTLTNQFNIMPVLQAVAQQRGKFHLTLIGDNGTGERYNDVLGFVHSHDITSDVTLLGLFSTQRLVEELPKHDITVIPMVSGALPNKVFDSIASGLPMLSLGTGDSSRLIEEHGLGWTARFDADDVVSLLDRITPEEMEEKRFNVLGLRSEYMHGTLFNKYERMLEGL